ncbi:phage shock protein A, PspA [Neobacillus vireti LMG 21834]|uniref:Phage shock protein A, PspA n=1 Tax=Neobacillus vireti LMG 21834 TaxID=1131730 RepID=A0AB94INP9_9BACI|nr:phage shock protein A, PspA [Neobacillus vireti LMG 21834]
MSEIRQQKSETIFKIKQYICRDAFLYLFQNWGGIRMSIISRFNDIMESNIDAILDKADDPDKMIKQYLKKLNSDLGKIKAKTASVAAEEQRAKRALNECHDDMEKMERYRLKALEAGNEGDTRRFLEKKAALAAELSQLQAAYQLASSNAQKMKQMHNKLIADIGQLLGDERVRNLSQFDK